MKPKYTKTSAILILLLFSFEGCKFFRIEPLIITRVTPDTVIVDTATVSNIDVYFSASANKRTAEGAFSLLKDGEKQQGIITWPDADHMTFSPYEPLTPIGHYEIHVDTTAEDEDGNSLEEEFSHVFRGMGDETRPTVLSISPDNEAKIDLLKPIIQATFSEPMNVSSVIDDFSLEPDAGGYFLETGGGTVFTYVLTEDLKFQKNYTITIGDSVKDLAGNKSGKKRTQTFYTGTESIKPSIISIIDDTTLTPIILDDPEDETFTVTTGLEKDMRIKVVFSEAMDPVKTEEGILLTPSIEYDASWDASGNSVTLSASEPFKYGETYTLSIQETCCDIVGNTLGQTENFSFVTNGSKSLPPKIARIDFLNVFTGSTPVSTVTLGHLGSIEFDMAYSTSSVIGFFDVYLQMAETATIDLFKFIDCFSVTATNASITPRACEIDGDITFSGIPVDQAFLAANPGVHVIRYITAIDNYSLSNKSIPGDIQFFLNSSFKDSLGNIAGINWHMRINTTN